MHAHANSDYRIRNAVKHHKVRFLILPDTQLELHIETAMEAERSESLQILCKYNFVAPSEIQ